MVGTTGSRPPQESFRVRGLGFLKGCILHSFEFVSFLNSLRFFLYISASRYPIPKHLDLCIRGSPSTLITSLDLVHLDQILPVLKFCILLPTIPAGHLGNTLVPNRIRHDPMDPQRVGLRDYQSCKTCLFFCRNFDGILEI